MSAAQSRSTLKSRLKALECHFTWGLDLSRSVLIRRRHMLEDIGTEEGNPWLGHIYNLLGFIHYQLDATEKARDFFNEATRAFQRLKNTDEGPWLVVNYGNLAWLHHLLGDEEQSRDYLSKVDALITKNLDPSDSGPEQDDLHPEICAEKAWTLMKFDKDQKLHAAEYFQRAVRMQPDMVHWQTSHVIGMVSAQKHSDMDLDDNIWEEMRRAREQDPDTYLAAVELLAKAKRNENVKDEADELAGRILQNPVSSYSGIKVLLRVYRHLEYIDEAIDVAEKALEEHPDERYLKRCTALCYKWKILFFKDSRLSPAKMERAISLLKQVIASYPDSSLMKKIDLANVLAKSSGGLMKADRQYQELLRLQLEPRDQQLVYNNFAKYLYFDKNNRDNSITYHMRVAKIPQESHFRKNSIRALEKIIERGRNRRCREIQMFLNQLKPL